MLCINMQQPSVHQANAHKVTYIFCVYPALTLHICTQSILCCAYIYMLPSHCMYVLGHYYAAHKYTGVLPHCIYVLGRYTCIRWTALMLRTRNILSMSFTLDTPHSEMSPLNDVPDRNMPFMLGCAYAAHVYMIVHDYTTYIHMLLVPCSRHTQTYVHAGCAPAPHTYICWLHIYTVYVPSMYAYRVRTCCAPHIYARLRCIHRLAP